MQALDGVQKPSDFDIEQHSRSQLVVQGLRIDSQLCTRQASLLLMQTEEHHACKMCLEFNGAPPLFLCSVCREAFERLDQRAQADISSRPLTPFPAAEAATSAFAEINEELAKMSPAAFSPLLAGHTARTLAFPISIEEAQAMRREHLAAARPEDAAVLDVLVARMDAFLLAHAFADAAGAPCAFAKLCDVSPKDALGSSLADVLPRAEAYAARYADSEGAGAHNIALQSLLFAKCTQKPTAAAPGARGIVALLCKSARCMTDQGLEMHGFPDSDPQPVEISLRDWVPMDPAFELRCFVNKDRLRGIAQMCSMGVAGVHCPQLLRRRDEVLEGARRFFEVVGPKLVPLSAGLMVPGRYVMDIYYDVTTARFSVIELNPFITSGAGHLFQEDYGERWLAWDAIQDTPIDFRLHQSTARDVLANGELPESWRSYLEKSEDVYG